MKLQKRQFLLAVWAVFAAFALGACGRPDSGIIQNRRGTGVKTDEVKAEETKEAEGANEDGAVSPDGDGTELYVLTRIDTENQTAAFEQESNGRQFQYAYDTGTKFLDKYGKSKPVTYFVPGDVVQIEVSGRTQQLKGMQLSPEVWVYEDIVNYSYDPSIRALTIGKSKYACDADMELFSGEGRISFDELGEADVLRAVGRDKKLISLSVSVGHGYLALSNTKLFEGSFICIGDKIFKEVTKNMQVEVPEGKYLVTVANDGYGGSREVEVKRDQTVTLNLDELKGEGPKICRIRFKVGVEGAVLWVDGRQADYSKPVEVSYGVHTISVEAEGYDTITEKLVVNSAEAEIEIALSGASEGKTENEKADADASGAGTADTNNNNSGNNGGAGGNNHNTDNPSAGATGYDDLRDQ